MDDQFPGNRQQPPSQKRLREEPEQREIKKIDRVVQGEVVRRKKPLGKRMKEVLLGGDSKSVGEYVFLDILIPGIRDIISDVATTSIERMVYGGDARSHRRPSQRGPNSFGHVRYGGPNTAAVGRASGREEPRAQMSRRGRTRHDFDEIILATKVEADEVLGQMFDLLEKFEEVTVADLYELCNVSSNYTDNKWGWTDLRGSGVTRVRGGYLLDLPEPDPLKD